MKWAIAWFAVAALALIYVFWTLADAGTFDLAEVASGPKWQAIFGGAVAALALGLGITADVLAREKEDPLPAHH